MSISSRWTANQKKFDNLQIDDTVEWKDNGWEHIVVDYQLVMVHVSQIIGE